MSGNYKPKPKRSGVRSAVQMSFDDETFLEPLMEKTANISFCKTWRFMLGRVWDKQAPRVCFVMLNPSTADSSVDDPTIRRCIGFAKRLGYGSIEVVNLYAFRTNDPDILFGIPDTGHARQGMANNHYIVLGARQASLVIAAWGADPRVVDRAKEVVEILVNDGHDLYCLGLTKDGYPRHPLYLSNETELVLYAEHKQNKTWKMHTCVSNSTH